MKRPDIIMHINYCEQGQELPEICRKAIEWGYDGVEFRHTRRQGEVETRDQYLDELARAVETATPNIIAFGSVAPDLMQPDADARQREADEYIDFLGKAKARFGATLFNPRTGALRNPDPAVSPSARELHGSGAAREEHYHWAAEGFKPIAQFAEAEGLTLAFETHGHYLHDLPLPAKRLVDVIDSPAVGVNFDYCNMLTFPDPVDLTESIEILQDKIYYLHLKNLFRLPGGGFVMTSLADGHINNRDLLRQVFAKGYNAPICIEAPRAGDREWFAREDLAYLQSLLDDLCD